MPSPDWILKEVLYYTLFTQPFRLLFIYLKRTIMKKIFFTVIIILVSCQKDDFSNEKISKTIDFGKFTLKTPLDWNRFYPQGTDGFFGGLTNTVDTLFFDYGPYAFSSVEDIKNTEETIIFEKLRVNSYDSKIIKRNRTKENRYFFGFYTDKRDNENMNSIYSYNPKDEDILREIFLSHKFK